MFTSAPDSYFVPLAIFNEEKKHDFFKFREEQKLPLTKPTSEKIHIYVLCFNGTCCKNYTHKYPKRRRNVPLKLFVAPSKENHTISPCLTC